MNLRQRLDNLPRRAETARRPADPAGYRAAGGQPGVHQRRLLDFPGERRPQAMQTIGRLIANPALSQPALSSPQTAEVLLRQLNDYQPLRAAALYDSNGLMLADLQRGDTLKLPARLDRLEHWRRGEYRLNALIELPQENARPGYLLLVASGELPSAFYTGTLTASLAILGVSVLLWLLVAQQIRRLITRPIRDLEELSRQVTREENYALRAPARQRRRDRPPGRRVQHYADSHRGPRAAAQARPRRCPGSGRAGPEPGRGNPPLEPQAGTGSTGARRQDREKLTGFQHYSTASSTPCLRR
ncbi:hypothetical protein ACPA9J_28905 [Pseudomonas aeruginosa]